MAITNIALDDATPAQRRAFATDFLNLDVKGNDNDATIRTKIKQAAGDVSVIFVNEPDTPEETAAGEIEGEQPLRQEEAGGRQSGTLGKHDPRALIIIPVSEAEGGDRDVMVGVNGRAWQLKRAAELDVPWRVVEALRNAVSDVVTHSDQPETLGEVNVRQARRVNFDLLRGPSKAEIEEWHARTNAEFCA